MSRRRALLPLCAGVVLLAASCGGSEQPIRIGLLADCEGYFAPFHDVTLAGAELPLLQRGGKLAGSAPVEGIEDLSVGGHDVELTFGCASETTSGTLEARRLVELGGAELVIGPNIHPTGAVLADYAKQHPEVTFVIATGEMLGHLDPGPNVFRFASTWAQATAGLGTYAFDELGWRRAVTIGSADPWAWANEAGFVAEFCALGGEIAEDVPAKLAEVPLAGSDGFLLAADPHSTGVFLQRSADGGLELARSVLVAPYALPFESAVAAELGDSLVGVVAASDVPLAAVPPSFEEYAAEFEAAFPQLAASAATTGHVFDLPFANAMEATLRALEVVDGDLSGGQRQFRAALTGVTLDAPNGAIRLDDKRQAIAPTYLAQVASNDEGTLVFRPLRTVGEVEASFAGRFGPGAAPPSRATPACVRGNPPPWASPGG
jgi:branched-chain amino acid transport system substrate-binding protein